MSYSEEVIAKVDELKDGEMKTAYLGELDVLVVKKDGEFFALAGYCPHYGAPLEMGVLSSDEIVCPWHHACFKIHNGDLSQPPARDGLTSFEVTIKGDDVIAKIPDDARESRIPAMSKKRARADDRHFVIIGGGAAGNAAAQALREENFGGRITMISKDAELPYDRPVLSKEYLKGKARPEWLPLRDPSFYKDYDIEVQLNTPVEAANLKEHTVQVKDGQTINYDKLLIASGANAKSIPVPGMSLRNVFTLRTLDDARLLAEALQSVEQVVIAGAGFIGLEVADSLRALNKSVAVVAPESLPFAPILGEKIGRLFKEAHESNGVRFYLNQSVKAFEGNGSVERVVLEDGNRLEAQLVIVGVGVTPVTGFVEGVAPERDGSLKVDPYLAITEDAFAAGDLARFPYFMNNGEHIRIEHWRVAEQQGRLAAKNMLGKKETFEHIPFFWTDQAGLQLRSVGYASGWDDIIFDGTVESKTFTAFYVRNKRIIAAVANNRDEHLAVIEALMKQQKMPDATQLKAQGIAKLKEIL